MSTQTRRKGNSAIGFIIFLAIIAYGIFVGIQYIPQYTEANSARTVLDNILDQSKMESLDTMAAVEGAINKQLYISGMTDLRNAFSVRRYQDSFEITVRYERELNLLFETRVMKYEKTVTLE